MNYRFLSDASAWLRGAKIADGGPLEGYDVDSVAIASVSNEEEHLEHQRRFSGLGAYAENSSSSNAHNNPVRNSALLLLGGAAVLLLVAVGKGTVSQGHGQHNFALQAGAGRRLNAEAPIAVDDAAQKVTDKCGGPNDLIVDVLANDHDEDGDMDPSTLLVATKAQKGAAKVVQEGGEYMIKYTPNQNFDNGIDTFIYQVCDSQENCDTATVTVILVASDNPPIADNDAAETTSGGNCQNGAPIEIDVLANDWDKDCDIDPSSLKITSQGKGGEAVRSKGGIVYTPAKGFAGEDAFEYEICDVLMNCNAAAVVVTVVPLPNRVPEPKDLEKMTNSDTPVTFSMDYTDPDCDELTANIAKQPMYGELKVRNNGNIKYTPAPGQGGTMIGEYYLTDGKDNSDIATLTIHVTETGSFTNDPPGDK